MKRLFVLIKNTLVLLGLFVGVMLLVGSIKVFLLASFKIPSDSMSPTLLSGDRIWVNKMIPGPRIFTNWNFISGGKLEYKRLTGYRALHRGEIAVFNFPYRRTLDTMNIDFNMYYVKRCLGLPGDSVKVSNGRYQINGMANMGCAEQQERLANTPDVYLESPFNSYPYIDTVGWSIKNFGPLYVPRQGDTISMCALHYQLYKYLIEFETKGTLSLSNDSIYLNQIPINKYIFTNNYYFMAGDNVLNSQDAHL